MNSEENKVGNKIQEIMLFLDLSMASFSKRVGLSNNATISRIVAEKVKPSYEVIRKILVAFPEINGNWLIADQGKMLNENPIVEEEISETSKKDSEANKEDLVLHLKQQLEQQSRMIDHLISQIEWTKKLLDSQSKTK